MRCDLHVHSTGSGMCRSGTAGRFCRECYSRPQEVYAVLRRRGMDLITLTDHDSIEGAERLRRHSDFFVSEELTCRLPSGTEAHVAVYDISDRQHRDLQRVRDDPAGLLIYLTERRIFFVINHLFSALTGPRRREDFDWVGDYFPAVETVNGALPRYHNLQAARLARRGAKIRVGGSDAHTLFSLATACTEVPGASDKREFFDGLRAGKGRVRGEHGGYWKLTRDIALILAEMINEKPWTAALAPLFLLLPAATLANLCKEALFGRHWALRVFREPARLPRFGWTTRVPATEEWG